MGKLCQLVAVERGIKTRNYNELTTLNKAVEKPLLFNGFHKRYKANDDKGEVLPEENQKVQFNAKEILNTVSRLMTESITMEARKDWTNCEAVANVSIDGTVLIKDAPISFLLYLEKQLDDVKTIASNIPLLDPAEDWTLDANSSLWKSKETQTHRTKKEQRPIVLIQPTPEHPGQAQLINEDILVGHWHLQKMSGALSKPEKTNLLNRIDRMIDAVKEATQTANMTEEVQAPDAGAAIFQYILAER